MYAYASNKMRSSSIQMDEVNKQTLLRKVTITTKYKPISFAMKINS